MREVGKVRLYDEHNQPITLWQDDHGMYWWSFDWFLPVPVRTGPFKSEKLARNDAQDHCDAAGE